MGEDSSRYSISYRSIDSETYLNLYITGVIKQQDGCLVIRNRICKEIFSVKNVEKQLNDTNDKERQTLNPIIEEGHETPVSSGNVVELVSIRSRCLGIDAQLIKNKDNLSDIEANS